MLISLDQLLSHRGKYVHRNTGLGVVWVTYLGKQDAKFIWHNGRTAEYTSLCGFAREEKVDVVVLNNSGISCDDLGFKIIKLLLKK